MKALLMHPDHDLDLQSDLPANAPALTQDLELDVLWRAMADGDEFLFDVARRVVLCSLNDPEVILYRQRVLADSLENPSVVRDIYAIAVAAIQADHSEYFGLLFGRSPDSTLYRSIRVLEAFVALLRRLKRVADEHGARFRSPGWRRFFAMIAQELTDDYFAEVQTHLQQLRFPNGSLISAKLGPGNRGRDHALRLPLTDQRNWMQRLLDRGEPTYSFEIADRDEAGIRALAELRGRGINRVADALAQSVDHILGFFALLRMELGFYVGCLNLSERLVGKGEPTCMPVPLPVGGTDLSAGELYDVCLALTIGDARVVGNDLEADGRNLVVVTGANQGGKSTFLRSIGLAYLMLQCGMFAPAERFQAAVRGGVFTHFKREEDAAMRSGKLDEELNRMSAIVDAIRPDGILLCNESFASTNEREGSEIARQIVRALLETGVRVFYVTHLFDLADGFRRGATGQPLFLRAERQPDGQRTFKLVVGDPLPTSYGADLYAEIFGQSRAGRATPAP